MSNQFLQGIYGFVVADYNYDSMLAYKFVAQYVLVLAGALSQPAWPLLHGPVKIFVYVVLKLHHVVVGIREPLIIFLKHALLRNFHSY